MAKRQNSVSARRAAQDHISALRLESPFHPRLDALSQQNDWYGWSGYKATLSLWDEELEYFAIRSQAALFDISPTPRKVKPPAPKPAPKRKPTIEERAILGINDAIQNVARQHLKAMEAIPQVLGTVTDLLLPRTSGDGKGATGGLPGIPDLAQMVAPKTPFNATVTFSSQRGQTASIVACPVRLIWL